MRLLLTGGAGYIGSIVAERLIVAGHDVSVLDDLSRGHSRAVPPEARLLAIDLLDRRAVADALAGEQFEAALHFAALALVSESVAHPELYWRTNVGGSLNLLDAMREGGIERLVFSSTCAVYGQPERLPIAEDAATRPESPYGSSKLAVDRMISEHCAAHGLGAASLRYFNVAGASARRGEDHEPETHLIPNVLRAAAGEIEHVQVYGSDYPTPDGTAVRDYIHVEDLADAHALALERIRLGEHSIFNLGNGEGFSVREVIDAARTATGLEIPIAEAPRRAGDPPRLVAAADHIRAELDWQPRKPDLETMIGDAWRWKQANPGGYGDR